MLQFFTLFLLYIIKMHKSIFFVIKLKKHRFHGVFLARPGALPHEERFVGRDFGDFGTVSVFPRRIKNAKRRTIRLMKKKEFLISSGFGALIGFINGFFGGGGGMIAVPVLENFFGFERKNSHATSIAVILPITLASAIIYLVGGKIDWAILGVCTAGVCGGGLLGAMLLEKTRSKTVGYVFCVVMLVAGIRMLF